MDRHDMTARENGLGEQIQMITEIQDGILGTCSKSFHVTTSLSSQ